MNLDRVVEKYNQTVEAHTKFEGGEFHQAMYNSLVTSMLNAVVCPALLSIAYDVRAMREGKNL